MLLTISTTAKPATDLGYLLFKHPDRAQKFPVSAGTAHVFYPVALPERCTAALLLEVDPLGQARQPQGGGHYVSDRPYAAGSLLAVTLGKVFGTAMTGRCDARPELADTPIPLEVHVPAAPCRGGAELAEQLLGPLGWRVDARTVPLDPRFPEWGDSHYLDLRLAGTLRLAEALRHLYVLLPVLDDAKHYRIGEDEVDKLLRAGADWLPAHPRRDLISARYLKHRAPYVRSALARLAELDDEAPESLDEPRTETRPLNAVRREAVVAALREIGARRVLDLGCGGGALLADLLADPSYTEVVGTDVSAGALAAAHRRLDLDRAPERVRDRVRLRQSSLTYSDASLKGYDAAVLMEVVEHVDPGRLPALERAVFATARPAHVVVTTPNVEHNVRFPGLAPGERRHPDHRFEWTRAEFREWAGAVADRRGYTVRHLPVGPDDPEVGPPTQMAVFSRKGEK